MAQLKLRTVASQRTCLNFSSCSSCLLLLLLLLDLYRFFGFLVIFNDFSIFSRLRSRSFRDLQFSKTSELYHLKDNHLFHLTFQNQPNPQNRYRENPYDPKLGSRIIKDHSITQDPEDLRTQNESLSKEHHFAHLNFQNQQNLKRRSGENPK